jgi:hypothetical protein
MLAVPTASLPKHLRFTRKPTTMVSLHPVAGVFMHDTGWSGGSRSDYRVIRLADGHTVFNHSDDFLHAPDGFAVLRTGAFRGQSAIPELFLHAADAVVLGFSLADALNLPHGPNLTSVDALHDWLIDRGRDQDARRVRAFLPVVNARS